MRGKRDQSGNDLKVTSVNPVAIGDAGQTTAKKRAGAPSVPAIL